ncbi:MAG TPA: TIGR02266 family protein [Myxococcaceae bacterium]
MGLLVKLKHSDVGSFAEEFATNLSPGGMFIRSRSPQPVGTLVKFEVQIAGGVRVLRGTAVVRWVRDVPDAEGPPGMGLQFQDLDPVTQALIDRMLELNRAAGRSGTAGPSTFSAEEVEKEMLAKGLLDRPGQPTTAPARPAGPSQAAPAAPKAGANAAPGSAPAKPAAPAPRVEQPGARLVENADLSALMDDLADLGTPGSQPLAPPVPVAPPAPRSPPPPPDASLGITPPPVPLGDVDISLDDLIADTPATPAAVQEVKFEVLDEPMPDVDFEMESLGGDVPVAVGLPLEESEPLSLPPPEPAPVIRGTPLETPVPVVMGQPVAQPPAAPMAQARAMPPPPPPTEMPAVKAQAVPPRAPPPPPRDEDESPTYDELGRIIKQEKRETTAYQLLPAADGELRKPGGGTEFELDLGSDESLELDKPGQSSRKGAQGRPAAPPPNAAARSVPAQAARPAPPPAVSVPAAAAPPVASAPEPRREAPRPPAPASTGDGSSTQVLDSPPVRPVPPEPPRSMLLPPTVFLKPPEQPVAGVGPVIGIDLGTTNSCVAIISGGKPTVLRSKEGYNTIPSVISLNAQGKLLVSHRAKNQLVLRPTQCIYGAKRLVGRPYDSAVVKQVRERFHYEITPDAAGRAAVRLADYVLSLEEVQGLILRECKEMAEQHLGQKVERAVVTVPAYYSEPQREAVRKAGLLAGLKVERVLNEPTSAALAYGLNRELNKRVLVYDLGGGTFDATVLRIEKNVFEVLATGGDIFLGGIDFDNALVDFLIERFQQLEGTAFMGDGVALSRVADAAEKAKIALSERNHHEVHIPMLMVDEIGRPRELRFTMTRAELERICEGLVTRTLDVVRDVLLDGRLKPSDIDDIILVGGQSRMPLVREKLKALFGKSAHSSVNADEAVALGAAMYSTALDKVSSVVLIDVLPMTIGLAMPGGAFQRVIERNSPLPAQRSFAVSTARDDEEVLELSIFQGEDNHISANEYLGTVRLEGLPKGPKGTVRVAVTIKLDAECVLFVEAREYTTRKMVRATLATRYTPDELAKQLKVDANAARAAEERRGADLKERAGRFWSFLKKVVGR